MKNRAEVKGQRAEVRKCGTGMLCVLILLPSALIPLPSAYAAPSQEDVLRSINSSVGEEVDGTKLLAAGLAVLAAAGILIGISYARKRVVNPRPLNSPGKLVKEIAREMNLRPAELRQLRTFAEQQNLLSPLVLLLCPSLLTKAVRDHPESADRGVLTSLARKTVQKEAIAA